MNVEQKIKVAFLVAQARVEVTNALRYFVQEAKLVAKIENLDPFLADILAWDNAVATTEIDWDVPPITKHEIDLELAGYREAMRPVDVPDQDISLDNQVIARQVTGCAAAMADPDPIPDDGPQTSSADRVKPGGGDKGADDPRRRPKPAALPTTGQKPLSDDEAAKVMRMHERGNRPATIAAALGRSAIGFHFTVNRLVKAAHAKTTPADPKQPPKPVSKAKEARPEYFMPEPAPGASLKEAALFATLNALGYPGPWSPVNDAILAVMLGNGDGVPAVVDQLGLPRDQVIARWGVLLPEKGIDEQALLLTVLKKRAEIYQRARGAPNDAA